MRLYNNLVQRCFNDCVDDFRSKHLSSGEEKVRVCRAARRARAALAQDVSSSSGRGWSSQQPRPAAKRNKAGDHASALCLQVGRRRVQFRD
jgi:hypothetical protein